jgi:hypothetical protein
MWKSLEKTLGSDQDLRPTLERAHPREARKRKRKVLFFYGMCTYSDLCQPDTAKISSDCTLDRHVSLTPSGEAIPFLASSRDAGGTEENDSSQEAMGGSDRSNSPVIRDSQGPEESLSNSRTVNRILQLLKRF